MSADHNGVIDSTCLNLIYKAIGSSHPYVEPGATLETRC